MRCPLLVNSYGEAHYCLGAKCSLAGTETGDCLIHKLLSRLTEEHEPIASFKEEPKFRPPTLTGDFRPQNY